MFGCTASSKHNLLSMLRLMSAYPGHFIDPVICKSLQDNRENVNDYNKLAFIPSKAAKSDESSSIFYNAVVQKVVNYISKRGNKKLARMLLEDTFETVKRHQIENQHLGKKKDYEMNPHVLLLQAIENSRPVMKLTVIRRGGVMYEVPVPVTEKQSYFLAIKWILEAAKEKERTAHLAEMLAWEILEAACGRGKVIKRKNDLHKRCECNRAYSHYRWS